MGKAKSRELGGWPKHVLRYLKGTCDYELCFTKTDEDLKLIALPVIQTGRLLRKIDVALQDTVLA